MKDSSDDKFQFILKTLFAAAKKDAPNQIFDPVPPFTEKGTKEQDLARRLNAAFLIELMGKGHPLFQKAKDFMTELEKQNEWKDVVGFYQKGRRRIFTEMNEAVKRLPDLAESFEDLWTFLSKPVTRVSPSEKIWRIQQLFFPEGTGINNNRNEQVEQLRQKRMVEITALNPEPIRNPAAEILFTSNVLLTVPGKRTKIDELSLSDQLKKELHHIIREPQLYWYDHPIPIGVEPDNNEVLYGLHALDEAVAFEKDRGTVAPHQKITVVLSVSVTHNGIHRIAEQYLKEELKKIRWAGSYQSVYVYRDRYPLDC